MNRAASWSSAIINFDAINQHQFLLCQMQSARKTGARFRHRIYGASFWSVCRGLHVGIRVSLNCCISR